MDPPEIIELSSEINKTLVAESSNINIQPDISSIINFQPELSSVIDKMLIDLQSLLGIEPI